MTLYRKCQNCFNLIEIKSEDSKKIFCSNYCRFRGYMKIHPERKAIYQANKNKRQQTPLEQPKPQKKSYYQKVSEFFKNVWRDN